MFSKTHSVKRQETGKRERVLTDSSMQEKSKYEAEEKTSREAWQEKMVSTQRR